MIPGQYQAEELEQQIPEDGLLDLKMHGLLDLQTPENGHLDLQFLESDLFDLQTSEHGLLDLQSPECDRFDLQIPERDLLEPKIQEHRLLDLQTSQSYLLVQMKILEERQMSLELKIMNVVYSFGHI